jgi:hypothetical protein
MSKAAPAVDGDGWSELCWCGRDWGDCLYPWVCSATFFRGGKGLWSPAASGKPASGRCTPRCSKCKRTYHPGLKCGETDEA